MIKLILASASTARRRLLENAGIFAKICPSDFDESLVKLTNPVELVNTLAEQKALTVSQSISQEKESYLVLGCDSLLVVEGQIHGKPKDEKEAFSRWQMMRGKIGQLYTGHALIHSQKQSSLTHCQITQVHFSHVSDQEIQAYINTGEPLQCAGCFALEGKGGLFIEKIVGCQSNVIGLSLPLFRQMLQQLGYSFSDFWLE